MIVIPPIPITSSVLASSTVAEPSAGEVVWNAAHSGNINDAHGHSPWPNFCMRYYKRT